MIVKIMPFTAVEPQRPGDLARLLRYLLTAKFGEPTVDIFLRLAGPPLSRRLIQRYLPWGQHARLAAGDLAQQMFAAIRSGWKGGEALPRQVFSHVVISYSPHLGRRSGWNSSVRTGMGHKSTYGKAVHIALDSLENLGVGEHFPLFLAAHGDRRHMHVHVVVAHFVAGSPPCRLHGLNSSTIRGIARDAASAYGLPTSSRLLEDRHQAVLDATRRRRPEGSA